jgi:hypothetical protein
MKAKSMSLRSNDPLKAFAASFTDAFDALPPTIAAEIVSPYRQQQRRLTRRDDLIREVAGELFGHLPRGFAGALAKRLKDFSDVGFNRDPKFDKLDEPRLRAILLANNNKTLGNRQIQSILAGHRTPPAK